MESGCTNVLSDNVFIYYGLTSGQYSCIVTQVFVPYWNFEYTKAYTPW